MKKIHNLIYGVGLALSTAFIFGVFSLPVSAVSNSISRGYKTTDQNIAAGMAVSLSSGNEDTKPVEATTRQNVKNFVGIITTIDDNIVSLTSDATNVLVTTTGEAPSFVSDINGSVAKGDLLTISPISGVLMKSNRQDTNAFTIGVALESFDPTQATDRAINDAQNGQKTVKVDKVNVEIRENLANVTGGGKEEDPGLLVAAGESLTGRRVGQVQVFAAILVLLVIMIVEGSIIYGAVHSTISALGRNPLAKKVVFKQILQVSWLALIVLIFGLGAIYIILWI